jgi:hypothetical protein
MTEQSRLTLALTVSLLLHGLLLVLLPLLRNVHLDMPAPQQLLDVDLASLPPRAARPVAPAAKAAAAPQAPPLPAVPLPERQIVAPPDAGVEQPPPSDTRLLSDRDNTVPEEQAHRSQVPNEPAKPPPIAEKEPAAAAEPAPKKEKVRLQTAPARELARHPADTQVASLPKLEQLLPQAGDFVSGRDLPAARPTPAQPQGEQRRLMMSGSHEAFSANRGISDFLPGIREGDITLLNTKAERFAPFVRRVAARLFQHLDIRLRQTASAGLVGSGREYAVVEAVMSKQGQLINARIVERQSTSTLGADRILLGVTQPDTFFDANPPPGAEANDGNIHFILLVDLMVQSVQDPRSGRVAAGYHGIAGVGLDSAPEDRSAGN